MVKNCSKFLRDFVSSPYLTKLISEREGIPWSIIDHYHIDIWYLLSMEGSWFLPDVNSFFFLVGVSRKRRNLLSLDCNSKMISFSGEYGDKKVTHQAYPWTNCKNENITITWSEALETYCRGRRVASYATISILERTEKLRIRIVNLDGSISNFECPILFRKEFKNEARISFQQMAYNKSDFSKIRDVSNAEITLTYFLKQINKNPNNYAQDLFQNYISIRYRTSSFLFTNEFCVHLLRLAIGIGKCTLFDATIDHDRFIIVKYINGTEFFVRGREIDSDIDFGEQTGTGIELSEWDTKHSISQNLVQRSSLFDSNGNMAFVGEIEYTLPKFETKNALVTYEDFFFKPKENGCESATIGKKRTNESSQNGKSKTKKKKT